MSDRRMAAANGYGVAKIAAERRRQISAEGWTPEHDDTHTEYELVSAAVAYAAEVAGLDYPSQFWPWDYESWRPGSDVRMLVKAGALIAAEIDRLLRLGGSDE